MSAPQAPVVPVPRAWPMFRAMVGIGLACGLLIVTVFETTRPVIARNRAEALGKAVFRVLPEATDRAAFRLTDAGIFEPVAGDAPDDAVHAGYDAAGRLVGLALPGAGMGYQDVIRVLYGYDPERQVVVGFQVLESRETPGLGTRIETDPEFLENFTALDVSLDAAGAGLANPVVAVKSGEKTEPWQVDGITGATISSEAVASLLDRSADRWLPRVRERLADFRKEATP